DSESGRGSTFHFTAKIRPVDQSTPAFPLEDAGLAGLRALVVEDNATSRRTLMEMLSSWEMKGWPGSGADGALRVLAESKLRGEPFTVALIDADMPATDGFSLAGRIKAEFEGEAAHLVMLLTSGDRSGDISRCERLGLDAYLMKPIN